jgi:thiosulfate reductase cytochrome b subunit
MSNHNMPEKMRVMRHPTSYFLYLALFLTLALAALTLGSGQAAAQSAPETAAPLSPLHPVFVLRDAAGVNVLESGQPVSTMQTCGACHDTAFIADHSFHADLGLAGFTAPGETANGRAWDTSSGLFGKWDPLTYRYLTPTGDERLDLSTAEWLMLLGARVAGGGPATTSRDGAPLTDLAPDAANPETNMLNADGTVAAWDWSESGVTEMDCFLCHLDQPDHAARTAALAAGDFAWANTATLAATGIVTQTADGWQWNPAAFAADGTLLPENVRVQDPTNANCAQCHGLVHTDADSAVTFAGCDLDYPQTATTGQVISAQKIAESGANIAGKAELARAWDVHAERQLACTDCHYAVNNPAHAQESSDTRPSHLVYDPRRLDIGEYLERPDHNFARGQSAQYTVAPELKGTMRRCESCHTADSHSAWLPYVDRHMTVLACESCHVPQLYAPAVEQVDWTVLQPDGSGVITCRGVDDPAGGIDTLIQGYTPVLLMRDNIDGGQQLAPYNLISAWYWVYDDANGAARPVRLADLQATWFEDGAYAPDLMALFDANGDGALDEVELRLDSAAKTAAVTARLAALGLANPRIEAEVQPYSINHNVTRGEWATRDCQSCHHDDAALNQPMQLASFTPGGVTPTFVGDTNVRASGTLQSGDGGALYFQPAPEQAGVYVFGRNRVAWVDWLGLAIFLIVLGAVAVHAGLRFYVALRRPRPAPELKRVYMYDAYERFWHWLQTLAIILLLFTGLVIHRPDLLGMFNFRNIVWLHNMLALVLVINAALSLFYHLTSGAIQQFIPRPYGFFDQAILQAKFYLRNIFKGGPHPMEKTKEQKLNPLQQVTYFWLLNVLLPLQIITGGLMWGVQQWPQVAGMAGGLPFLAPLHTLVAWLFATFIVAHVYLTTTGPAVLTDIKAMITGWEDVEVHEHPAVQPEQA